MVLACLDERSDTYLIVGVIAAPEMGDIRKKWVKNMMNMRVRFWPVYSQFGVAFLEAQSRSNARTKHSSFDTSVVEVSKEDLQAFLTKLQL